MPNSLWSLRVSYARMIQLDLGRVRQTDAVISARRAFLRTRCHLKFRSFPQTYRCGPCFSARSSWLSGQLQVKLVIVSYHSGRCRCPHSDNILLEPLCTGFKVLLILVNFGIPYLVLPIMFEQSAGHRLLCENLFGPSSGSQTPLSHHYPC